MIAWPLSVTHHVVMTFVLECYKMEHLQLLLLKTFFYEFILFTGCLNIVLHKL